MDCVWTFENVAVLRSQGFIVRSGDARPNKGMEETRIGIDMMKPMHPSFLLPIGFLLVKNNSPLALRVAPRFESVVIPIFIQKVFKRYHHRFNVALATEDVTERIVVPPSKSSMHRLQFTVDVVNQRFSADGEPSIFNALEVNESRAPRAEEPPMLWCKPWNEDPITQDGACSEHSR